MSIDNKLQDNAPLLEFEIFLREKEPLDARNKADELLSNGIDITRINKRGYEYLEGIRGKECERVKSVVVAFQGEPYFWDKYLTYWNSENEWKQKKNMI